MWVSIRSSVKAISAFEFKKNIEYLFGTKFNGKEKIAKMSV
jgi:hypothetical protein